MPQIVEVDGVGEVEFDDGMSLDDIKVAIERDILPMFREQAASAPEATDISTDFGVLVENRGGVPVAIVGGKAVPMEQLFPREFSTAFGETAAAGEITPDRLSTAAQRVLADREARARRVDARINPAQFNEPQFRANPAEQAELTRLENARNEFARSAFSATLQSAQALSKVDEALFEGAQRPQLGEMARGRTEMFEGMQQAAREVYPTDPRYQGEFLASTLPMTAGSVAPFMLTGAAGGALPSSILGALMTAQQEYDSAIAAGASEEEARKAGLAGLPIGLTEGLGSIGKGIGSVPGGFKGWLKSIASENLQELSQSGLQTLNASYLSGYDPSRRLSGQEILDTVAATSVISGGMNAPGAIANRNVQPEGAGEIPEEQGPNLDAVAAALYDDEVQETPAPSAPTQEAPPVQAAPPNPLQQASSRLLGQDDAELRQQEAIISGQPVPELEEEVVEEVTTPTEETVTEEVSEPSAPELITPEGLTALEPDSFERLADQPVQEGFRALQDQETFDVFQVPQNATAEEIEAARQQARQEGERLARQYEFEEQRRIRQEEFERGQREVQELQSITRRGQQQPATPQPEFRNLWDNPENLKRILDQQEQNLRRAQAGTLRDPSGQPVTPQQLESGVQALRDRYNELTGKQKAAKTAAKGMKRGKRGEQGSTTIPQAVTEFASAIYREGVQFKDWSRQMLRSLGQNIRPFLQDIWNSLTQAVNALSPSQRARVETRMQRRDFSEGGAVGSAGGSTAAPPPTATPEPSPAPEEQPIGIANAQTEAARQRIGLDPRFAPARRTFGRVWDEAMNRIGRDPNYPTNLINELAVDPRPTTDVEVATLVYARVLAEQSYDASVNEVNSATNEADSINAQALLQRSKQELDKIYTVAESVGTATSRGLNARKLLVNRDLTLAQMRAETRAIENKGQPLTPEQEQRIDQLHAELEAAKKKIAELEEKQAKAQSEMTFAAMMKEIKGDRREALKAGKTVTEFLNDQAAKARARFRDKVSRANAFVDPTILVDLAIIGASHIANGINTAAEFAAKIIEEFGDEFEPHIPEIFKEATEFHQSNLEQFSKQTGGSESVKEETPEQVIARATAELDPKLVFDLARAYVRQGMTGEANVMSAVHQALLPLMPELTLREVRDAFSGYGKVKYPSKEDDLVKLREYRTLARLQSQLEDVQNRTAPLRTGMQRDKMTAEARLLQKQINDLMKKYDLRPTDPLQQLKTSREAVKARLRNEIEELERSLATRTRRPQNRNPIEYDEETKALQERRNKLRERYQEMFPPQAPSVEQRIKQTLNALDKAIAEETQMLKDGVLKRPARPEGPTTPEIENKRMELDALRQLRRELFAATQPRKSAEDVALEQAIKSAQESIKRMDEMMRSGNIDPKTKAPKFTPTDELENLWMVRDSMRDALNELRKANKPRKDPEETARKKAVKSLTKAIEDLDRRIASGDFSARPKKATRPEVREVAELRARKEALRQALTDMKKAATPARSPEDIKLSRDKKNIRRRIEQLQEKIRNSDYTVTPKPDPVMDKEKLELQRQYQAVRKEYLKGLFEAQLRQRTLAGKLWGGTKEALNTSRSILTSMDFSGVLRQGGVIVFGNPVRAVKALPAMFRSFASEKAYDTLMLEIQNRPNYPLYQQAKLYLADTAPASLSQMEEAYMSRWSNRIPGVAGSQRAYVAFLNKLRADSFDAMIAGLAKNGIPTKEESRAVANYVNVATGRGDLGKFAGAGELLNTAFFAPRYVLSRFQILAGQPLYGGTARTRKMIALEYAKFLGGVGVAMALAALAGDDEERGEIFGIPVPIETDPRSADFLKVRFGNTRLDMLAGLIQATVVMARLGTNTAKSGDRVYELTGQDRRISDPDWMDTALRFGRSKLSPILGTIIDIKTGENLIGEPVTWQSGLVRGVVPLSVSEIDETMQEQGIPKGVALQLLSMFGVGLQTYDQRERKSSRSNPYSSN